MGDLELEEYLKDINDYAKTIASSRERSKKFLIELGIVDNDGKLTGIYACTPTDIISSSPSTAVTKKQRIN